MLLQAIEDNVAVLGPLLTRVSGLTRRFAPHLLTAAVLSGWIPISYFSIVSHVSNIVYHLNTCADTAGNVLASVAPKLSRTEVALPLSLAFFFAMLTYLQIIFN
jgi:hypothetical protein